MWDWLDRQREQGIEALAIPHNMDKSRGQAFPETAWKGRPLRAFAEQRLRNEPVVEIIQEKGASETHPLLSPDDEWADFQTFRYYDGRESPVGDYYREGLGRGLAIERRIGVNPYRFGAVGGSDSKLGAGAFDETRERVFDVACSDGLQPDLVSHRCPDNGARVDLADCSTSRDKGAEALRTVWTDPDFDTGQPAFYYVWVLENPSCRWSTWDVVRVGVEPNPVLPPVIQERAWTSPIWYAPAP